jgi:hypothetical protein
MPLRSRAFARQKLCLDLYVSLHSDPTPVVVRACAVRASRVLLRQKH